MLFDDFSQFMSSQRFYQYKVLKKQLAQAENYQEWKYIAEKIDEVSGANVWRNDPQSPYFDVETIQYRLNLLQRYRSSKTIHDLIHILREELRYDTANISHPMLYSVSFVGTKKVIEDYLTEVSQALIFVAQADENVLSKSEKIKFFEACKKTYGQPAIMFSGGATLGLFHTGVCKALLEQDLMPDVISGASAGAIFAGLLGTVPKSKMMDVITQYHFVNEPLSFKRIFKILQQKQGIADIKALQNFLIELFADITFEEAFDCSGKHINVAVAPYHTLNKARIMNKYTSPDLLVWSAVLASCAVPVLFPAVQLTSKRYDGQYTPYMANTKWVDGSMRIDFPQGKMARLYNLNYTIASQSNPHIVPFLQSDLARFRKDLLSWPQRILRRQGTEIAKELIDFSRDRAKFIPIAQHFLDLGYGILDQRYYGNINIFGHFNLRHYGYMLQNPNPKLFKILQKEGERATWPKIAAIEAYARTGKTIDFCLNLLAQHEP